MNRVRNGDAAIMNAKNTNAKPRGWTGERLTEWFEPPALSVDYHGYIHDSNTSSERLFGCERKDLVNQHVSILFPQLSDVELAKDGEVNPSLNHLCRCGHYFQTQNQRGDIFSSNLSIVRVGNELARSFRMIVRPHGGWERGRFVYRKSESGVSKF